MRSRAGMVIYIFTTGSVNYGWLTNLRVRRGRQLLSSDEEFGAHSLLNSEGKRLVFFFF